MNVIGIVTASSKPICAGFRATSLASVVTNEPRHDGASATTSSPTLECSTPSPRLTIVPAHSHPRSRDCSKTGGMRPMATSTSRKLSPTARTRISTWPGAGFLCDGAAQREVVQNAGGRDLEAERLVRRNRAARLVRRTRECTPHDTGTHRVPPRSAI